MGVLVRKSGHETAGAVAAERLNLNWFLRFGHFLDHDPGFRLDFSRVDRDGHARLGSDELVERFERAFRTAIERRFRPGADHVVPLSGGFDSRAVLGFLLQFTPASAIRTYTFGTPGTSDFETGGRVARLVGTRHTALPMTHSEWRREDMRSAARLMHHQTRLFHAPPVLAIERHFGGALCWSGFLGEIAAGASLPEEHHETETEAYPYYALENRLLRDDLTDSASEDLYAGMRLRAPVPPQQVSWYEQISFQTEESLLTAPHVLHGGVEHACPFLEPELFGFLLSLPDALRRRRRGYKLLLACALPELFALPSKSNDDLPLSAPPVRHVARRLSRKLRRAANRLHPLFLDRRVNYLDFHRELATNPALEQLLRGCLEDLRARDIVPWIDLRRVWSEEDFWRKRHLDAILLLASLEIHLEAGRRPGKPQGLERGRRIRAP